MIKTSLKLSDVWLAVLIFLGLKVLFQEGALLPTGIWPGEHGLRILYLHLVLLGFGSAALIVAFYPASERSAKWIFIAGAGAVQITLGMFNGYWPKALIPGNQVYCLAVTALLLIGPTIWLLFKKVKC